MKFGFVTDLFILRKRLAITKGHFSLGLEVDGELHYLTFSFTFSGLSLLHAL